MTAVPEHGPPFNTYPSRTKPYPSRSYPPKPRESINLPSQKKPLFMLAAQENRMGEARAISLQTTGLSEVEPTKKESAKTAKH